MWILKPISFLFGLLVTKRRKNFLKNPYKSWKPDLPLIVIGNILVGGTGKTPLVISLANSLKTMGYKPGIVSRGMGVEQRNTL